MKQSADSLDSAPGAAPAAAILAQRDRLRRECLAAREALDTDTHARLSAAVAARLAEHLQSLPPARIGFCFPIRKEFDPVPLIRQLLLSGWQAVVPVVDAPAAAMHFRPWSPATPMTTDRHGIPVPVTEAATDPSTDAITAPFPEVLLLPLVAFDDKAYRLGYGGGYFDRTLAACVPRPLCIGVGFELGHIATTYPQHHDQPCDLIITELGKYTTQVTNL